MSSLSRRMVTVIHADLTQANDVLRVSANTLVPTDGIIIGGIELMSLL